MSGKRPSVVIPESMYREISELRAENERLKKAILSYGNGSEFDWDVLDKIDELETENKRLKVEIAARDADVRSFLEKIRERYECLNPTRSDGPNCYGLAAVDEIQWVLSVIDELPTMKDVK